jgi:hypothetical protein
VKKFFIRKLHKFILWYTRDCAGGDFHVNPYGFEGRYIVCMNEAQYHHYMKNVHYGYRLPKVLIPKIRREFPQIVQGEIVPVDPTYGKK